MLNLSQKYKLYKSVYTSSAAVLYIRFKHAVLDVLCCNYRCGIGVRVSCVYANLTDVLTTLTLSEYGEVISSF